MDTVFHILIGLLLQVASSNQQLTCPGQCQPNVINLSSIYQALMNGYFETIPATSPITPVPQYVMNRNQPVCLPQRNSCPQICPCSQSGTSDGMFSPKLCYDPLRELCKKLNKLDKKLAQLCGGEKAKDDPARLQFKPKEEESMKYERMRISPRPEMVEAEEYMHRKELSDSGGSFKSPPKRGKHSNYDRKAKNGQRRHQDLHSVEVEHSMADPFEANHKTYPSYIQVDKSVEDPRAHDTRIVRRSYKRPSKQMESRKQFVDEDDDEDYEVFSVNNNQGTRAQNVYDQSIPEDYTGTTDLNQETSRKHKGRPRRKSSRRSKRPVIDLQNGNNPDNHENDDTENKLRKSEESLNTNENKRQRRRRIHNRNRKSPILSKDEGKKDKGNEHEQLPNERRRGRHREFKLKGNRDRSRSIDEHYQIKDELVDEDETSELPQDQRVPSVKHDPTERKQDDGGNSTMADMLLEEVDVEEQHFQKEREQLNGQHEKPSKDEEWSDEKMFEEETTRKDDFDTKGKRKNDIKKSKKSAIYGIYRGTENVNDSTKDGKSKISAGDKKISESHDSARANDENDQIEDERENAEGEEEEEALSFDETQSRFHDESEKYKRNTRKQLLNERPRRRNRKSKIKRNRDRSRPKDEDDQIADDQRNVGDEKEREEVQSYNEKSEFSEGQAVPKIKHDSADSKQDGKGQSTKGIGKEDNAGKNKEADITEGYKTQISDSQDRSRPKYDDDQNNDEWRNAESEEEQEERSDDETQYPSLSNDENRRDKRNKRRQLPNERPRSRNRKATIKRNRDRLRPIDEDRIKDEQRRVGNRKEEEVRSHDEKPKLSKGQRMPKIKNDSTDSKQGGKRKLNRGKGKEDDSLNDKEADIPAAYMRQLISGSHDRSRPKDDDGQNMNEWRNAEGEAEVEARSHDETQFPSHSNDENKKHKRNKRKQLANERSRSRNRRLKTKRNRDRSRPIDEDDQINDEHRNIGDGKEEEDVPLYDDIPELLKGQRVPKVKHASAESKQDGKGQLTKGMGKEDDSVNDKEADIPAAYKTQISGSHDRARPEDEDDRNKDEWRNADGEEEEEGRSYDEIQSGSLSNDENKKDKINTSKQLPNERPRSRNSKFKIIGNRDRSRPIDEDDQIQVEQRNVGDEKEEDEVRLYDETSELPEGQRVPKVKHDSTEIKQEFKVKSIQGIGKEDDSVNGKEADVSGGYKTQISGSHEKLRPNGNDGQNKDEWRNAEGEEEEEARSDDETQSPSLSDNENNKDKRNIRKQLPHERPRSRNRNFRIIGNSGRSRPIDEDKKINDERRNVGDGKEEKVQSYEETPDLTEGRRVPDLKYHLTEKKQDDAGKSTKDDVILEEGVSSTPWETLPNEKEQNEDKFKKKNFRTETEKSYNQHETSSKDEERSDENTSVAEITENNGYDPKEKKENDTNKSKKADIYGKNRESEKEDDSMKDGKTKISVSDETKISGGRDRSRPKDEDDQIKSKIKINPDRLRPKDEDDKRNVGDEEEEEVRSYNQTPELSESQRFPKVKYNSAESKQRGKGKSTKGTDREDDSVKDKEAHISDGDRLQISASSDGSRPKYADGQIKDERRNAEGEADEEARSYDGMQENPVDQRMQKFKQDPREGKQGKTGNSTKDDKALEEGVGRISLEKVPMNKKQDEDHNENELSNSRSEKRLSPTGEISQKDAYTRKEIEQNDKNKSNKGSIYGIDREPEMENDSIQNMESDILASNKTQMSRSRGILHPKDRDDLTKDERRNVEGEKEDEVRSYDESSDKPEEQIVQKVKGDSVEGKQATIGKSTKETNYDDDSIKGKKTDNSGGDKTQISGSYDRPRSNDDNDQFKKERENVERLEAKEVGPYYETQEKPEEQKVSNVKLVPIEIKQHDKENFTKYDKVLGEGVDRSTLENLSKEKELHDDNKENEQSISPIEKLLISADEIPQKENYDTKEKEVNDTYKSNKGEIYGIDRGTEKDNGSINETKTEISERYINQISGSRETSHHKDEDDQINDKRRKVEDEEQEPEARSYGETQEKPEKEKMSKVKYEPAKRKQVDTGKYIKETDTDNDSFEGMKTENTEGDRTQIAGSHDSFLSNDEKALGNYESRNVQGDKVEELRKYNEKHEMPEDSRVPKVTHMPIEIKQYEIGKSSQEEGAGSIPRETLREEKEQDEDNFEERKFQEENEQSNSQYKVVGRILPDKLRKKNAQDEDHEENERGRSEKPFSLADEIIKKNNYSRTEKEENDNNKSSKVGIYASDRVTEKEIQEKKTDVTVSDETQISGSFETSRPKDVGYQITDERGNVEREKEDKVRANDGRVPKVEYDRTEGKQDKSGKVTMETNINDNSIKDKKTDNSEGDKIQKSGSHDRSRPNNEDDQTKEERGNVEGEETEEPPSHDEIQEKSEAQQMSKVEQEPTDMKQGDTGYFKDDKVPGEGVGKISLKNLPKEKELHEDHKENEHSNGQTEKLSSHVDAISQKEHYDPKSKEENDTNKSNKGIIYGIDRAIEKKNDSIKEKKIDISTSHKSQISRSREISRPKDADYHMKNKRRNIGDEEAQEAPSYDETQQKPDKKNMSKVAQEPTDNFETLRVLSTPADEISHKEDYDPNAEPDNDTNKSNKGIIYGSVGETEKQNYFIKEKTTDILESEKTQILGNLDKSHPEDEGEDKQRNVGGEDEEKSRSYDTPQEKPEEQGLPKDKQALTEAKQDDTGNSTKDQKMLVKHVGIISLAKLPKEKELDEDYEENKKSNGQGEKPSSPAYEISQKDYYDPKEQQENDANKLNESIDREIEKEDDSMKDNRNGISAGDTTQILGIGETSGLKNEDDQEKNEWRNIEGEKEEDVHLYDETQERPKEQRVPEVKYAPPKRKQDEARKFKKDEQVLAEDVGRIPSEKLPKEEEIKLVQNQSFYKYSDAGNEMPLTNQMEMPNDKGTGKVDASIIQVTEGLEGHPRKHLSAVENSNPEEDSKVGDKKLQTRTVETPKEDNALKPDRVHLSYDVSYIDKEKASENSLKLMNESPLLTEHENQDNAQQDDTSEHEKILKEAELDKNIETTIEFSKPAVVSYAADYVEPPLSKTTEEQSTVDEKHHDDSRATETPILASQHSNQATREIRWGSVSPLVYILSFSFSIVSLILACHVIAKVSPAT